MALLVPMLIAGLVSYVGRQLLYHLAFRLLFEPRSDDIFIVTYPKSGTTLLQQMVYQITTDGSMDFPHIDAVAPWLDTVLLRNPAFVQRMRSPRIFKTHRKVKHVLSKGKIIYCVRNPKDTCVSSFYHATSINNDRSTLNQYVWRFLHGPKPWGSWFEHFEASFPYRHHDTVLFVSFERLRSDLEGVVDQVSKFCGVELDEAKRRAVVERCAISFMKQHNSKFDPRLSTHGDTDRRNPSLFIRKGEVGQWCYDLSPEQSALIETELKKTLRRLREANAEDLAFLASGNSKVKGCVSLRAVNDECHPKGRCLAEISTTGLRLFQSVGGLAVGDEIVLRLSLKGTKRVLDDGDSIACHARVAYVGGNDGPVDFEFSNLHPKFVAAVQRLNEMRPCLALER